MKYDHASLESVWQQRWMDANVFAADDGTDKPKFYCLIEFPYPSGAGLHMGHPRSYTALDVLSRKRRMQGYNVLYPIGWDAFGLPTENYAIKTGRKPQDVTRENIATFKRQLQSLGIGFDWSREVNTTDPAYYKWTQWMFLEFFKAGLCYKKRMPINWCMRCKIGLANEEVVDGVCERCGGAVEKREKEQWMIAITKYADRLLEDLNTVDYLPKIRKQQEDWIGRSEGAEIEFALKVPGQADGTHTVTVFTTRPDTIFGATFLVVSPELARTWMNVGWKAPDDVVVYVDRALKQTEIDRSNDQREKTGVDTGIVAVNPANEKEVPVFVADYVLGGYGTGAIMAVPAHDERDYAFAKKYALPIACVVSPFDFVAGQHPRLSFGDPTEDPQQILMEIHGGQRCYVGEGRLMSSDDFNGLSTGEAKTKITTWLEEQGLGRKKVTYRLRDWVFSRQRYWGEPIPLVKCAGSCGVDQGGWVPVPTEQLPVVLPEVEKYEPTDTGESPLAAVTDWVNTTCPSCGGPAMRETDTMPNWAGSSWYFLRYIDPKNDHAFADPDKLKRWMPVDWYNGGMEHTTLHLLYSRFWNKVLFDLGHVPVSEPYAKRTSHGLVLAADGTKMSKSKGNVVNPDDVVAEYGADALRLYELFIGPFGEPAPWKSDGLVGMRRFLERVMDLPNIVTDVEEYQEAKRLNKLIKKVTDDIDTLSFNTAVAAMMEFNNYVIKEKRIHRGSLRAFLTLLSPFAPHTADETWSRVDGNTCFLIQETWPEAIAAMLVDDTCTIGVQVNGKIRGEVTLSSNATEEEARAFAMRADGVAKHVDGKQVKQFVYVPGRIISMVVE